jgi:hypothetical protein
MEPKNKRREPTAALQSAIEILERYARTNNKEPSQHVADLTALEHQLEAPTQSSLKKTIHLVRDFITTVFSRKVREERKQELEQVKNLVLQAIDTVKRHHLFIDKLKEGNTEERKLAASTLEAIKRYNCALDDSSEKDKKWKTPLARFLYTPDSNLSFDDELKKNRIDLPPGLTFQANPLSSIFTPKTQSIPILNEEADAIRLKASSLIRQHGIRFKNPNEAINLIRQAPISATIDSPSLTSTLCLTVSVLPGIVIKVKGSFKRDPKSVAQSVPIPDSFQLSLKSTQAGFPHPSQYTGWALCDALIPAYPHRLDQLPLFHPVYERKKIAMQGLLPDGNLLDPAKQLLQLKQQAFNANSQEFIPKHCELALAILNAAYDGLAPEHDQDTIKNYYRNLILYPDVFDYFTETHNAINYHFIYQPQSKLQEIWLERSNANLFDKSPAVIYKEALKILEEEVIYRENLLKEEKNHAHHDLDKYAIEYVICMGKSLSRATFPILLQHTSENLGSTPPMLHIFEQKVQAATYRQLQSFLNEMNNELPSAAESVTEILRKQIDLDIALFKAESIEAIDPSLAALVHELEVYFNTRYYVMKH